MNFSGALKFVSEKLKANKEVVMTAVLQNSRSLEFAFEKLKTDEEILAAIAATKVVVVVEEEHVDLTGGADGGGGGTGGSGGGGGGGGSGGGGGGGETMQPLTEISVRQWLQQLNLERLVMNFENEEILTMNNLILLTENDLKEMKVSVLKILFWLKYLYLSILH